MGEQIQTRLNELKRQFEAGQIELQQLQSRENHVRETMLRISGAMQVLEELAAQVAPNEVQRSGSSASESDSPVMTAG